MKTIRKDIYGKLHKIYEKHRGKYKENFDSKQMCLMWSTDNPPDIIEGTKPIIDIENEFDVKISDEESMEIYDMTIEEAALKLASIIEHKC